MPLPLSNLTDEARLDLLKRIQGYLDQGLSFRAACHKADTDTYSALRWAAYFQIALKPSEQVQARVDRIFEHGTDIQKAGLIQALRTSRAPTPRSLSPVTISPEMLQVECSRTHAKEHWHEEFRVDRTRCRVRTRPKKQLYWPKPGDLLSKKKKRKKRYSMRDSLRAEQYR